METLKKYSTVNSPVLRIIVLVLIVGLPIIGFVMGMQYQSFAYVPQENKVPLPTIQSRQQTVAFPLLQSSCDEKSIGLCITNIIYNQLTPSSFSLEYPKSWKVNNDGQSFGNSKDILNIWVWGPRQKEGTEMSDGAVFGIGQPVKTDQNLKDWVRENYGEKSEITGLAYEYSTKTIGNRTFETMYACGQNCFTYYHFREGSYIYRISTVVAGPSENVYKTEITNMLAKITFQ